MMIYRNIDWKGMADGIEAFETCIKSSDIKAKLILVGEKPNFELKEYMEFYEHPNTASLRWHYNQADIFLFPSWNEGFGLPPMEAMCCGTVVVTTDVGAIPDYAQDRETALLSPPKNSSRLAINLDRAMRDAGLRTQLANNAKHFMEYYTWERYATKLMEVLTKEDK